MKKFRTYQLARDFYQNVSLLDWPSHLRDQALRAASSVVLNIAEGAGLPSNRQKLRHYGIALGSLREVQAALDISGLSGITEACQKADSVAAHLYRLCQSLKS